MNRLLRDICYFLILILMVVGITGVIFHAVGADGWIGRFFGGLVDQGISTAVMVFLGLGCIGWLARRWLIATQANALFNDFLVYAMIALGVFFFARLVLYGTL